MHSGLKSGTSVFHQKGRSQRRAAIDPHRESSNTTWPFLNQQRQSEQPWDIGGIGASFGSEDEVNERIHLRYQKVTSDKIIGLRRILCRWRIAEGCVRFILQRTAKGTMNSADIDIDMNSTPFQVGSVCIPSIKVPHTVNSLALIEILRALCYVAIKSGQEHLFRESPRNDQRA
jgi:hypothetical protein